MRRILPLLMLPSLACGPSVADEMERALRLSNDAIAFSLLAAEGAAWIDATEPTRTGFEASWPSEPGVRHKPPGDCPKISRDPDEGEPFFLEAIYTGCVSGSRLTPTILQGGLTISGTSTEAALDFGALAVNYQTPVGAPVATRFGAARVYRITGELAFPDDPVLAAISAELHVDIDHSQVDSVTLDGHLLLDSDLGPARVDLHHVAIALDDIPGECALPHSGSARVDARPEIEIDFNKANDDGKVVVRRRSRESTPSRLCSFASDVL